jgi:Zinc carboxypeptidase
MKNAKSGKTLPGIISGLWVLNIAGIFGLIAFFWYESRPVRAVAHSLPTETAPTQEAATDIATIDYLSSAGLDQLTLIERTVQVIEPPEIATPDITPTPLPGNPTIIGYSVAGRPLEVYKYGNGPTGRIIVAGIHGGNESNTIKLAHELMMYIEEHPKIIPANITLYILPDLNPDGEARAHGVDGRVNDHGVDLNRNWPYKWVKDYDRSSCWHYRETSAGDYGASEPETSALLTFIVSHPEINALISYHAAALGIFAGGVPEFKPSIRLAKGLAKVSTFQYPPMDIGCVYTGNLTDWASSTQDIAAVDIELHDFRHTDFDENLKILKSFLSFR